MKNKITILILAITLVSCSTRKVAKSEVKETTEVREIDTTKTVTNTQKFERSVDTSTVNEFEIVPIDITKPMVVNGKSYLNAILKRKVTKLNKVVELTEKVAQIQRKGVNKAIKTERAIKEKQTERKSGFNWWWLLFLLIPIAYLKYKKYI
jgi:PBP1b-binding outer membrane lipoprotein LpoB